MYYLGIDVAKRSHRAVVLDSQGEKLSKSFSFDNSQEGMKSLTLYLEKRPISKTELLTGMEATGNYWENLYSFLTNKGFKVILLNPYQVNKFRQALGKKAKTDDIDALVIAGLLRSNEYQNSYVPPEKIENLRELTKLRYEFIKDLRNYKRQAMSLLNLVFPEYQKTVIKNPSAIASAAILKEYPTAIHLAQTKPKKIERIVRSIKGNNFNIREIEHLISTAKDSIYSGKSAEIRGMNLKMILSHIQNFEESIKTIDDQIDAILFPSQDDNNQPGGNLFTIPGVGPKIVATFLSIAGENGNAFEKGTKIIGHIGFFPQIFESGEKRKDNKISNRGPKYARWGFYIGSVTCIKHNPEFRQLYHNKISQGKTGKQAIIYVGKKLIHMMLSMAESDETYSPEQVFKPIHLYKCQRATVT
ncbi:MAG: IS110 family transposase [bacterium]|nr:IS110 family transposase [bacterium]